MQTLGQGNFLTLEMLRWYSGHYLSDAQHASDVRASPLRNASLTGIAPATIITAEYDPLRDQGELYGQRLTQAGVAATVYRWPGQIHGFMSMQGLLDGADKALDTAAAALRAAFAPHQECV